MLGASVGKEVRLLMGLGGGGGSWSLRESGVGIWAELRLGLKRGKGLWLIDSMGHALILQSVFSVGGVWPQLQSHLEVQLTVWLVHKHPSCLGMHFKDPVYKVTARSVSTREEQVGIHVVFREITLTSLRTFANCCNFWHKILATSKTDCG